MAQNFIECDREQVFLMPPSLREWLPEDHLAWFVLDAVEQMDLAASYVAYRADGHGRAAHDPASQHRHSSRDEAATNFQPRSTRVSSTAERLQTLGGTPSFSRFFGVSSADAGPVANTPGL